MHSTSISWAQWLPATLFLSIAHFTSALPTNNHQACLADPACGPIPGSSPIYSSLTTIEPAWPGNTTGAILNTTSAAPAADDTLFQNLLAAEWIIFSFYQAGVSHFTPTSFTAAGFSNTTHARLLEIRNNEAGHLRIFQNSISPASTKPGPCNYTFPFDDAASYLALQTIIEVSSMVFLTGLELQAVSDSAKSALVAIAEVETRHNTWSLINNWQADPFAGPADTAFPYANQILDYTGAWVVPGSCPAENPIYPYPRQGLPRLSAANATSIQPGAEVKLSVSGGEEPLRFAGGQDFFAVFFHGLLNVSVPLDTETMHVVVPANLEAKGVFVVVLATEEGAPNLESVVAGPLVFLEEPKALGLELLG